jgi:4-cresol dehydrogenase (hydroxylating)
MTVWLMPAPEHFEAFFFMCRDERSLPGVIEALRRLRLSGTLRSVVHIGNDYKVLAASKPRAAFGEDFGPDQVPRLRDELRIGAWNGSGGLYGTRRQVREARRLLRRALAGQVDRLQFVDDRLLGVMRRFAGPFRLVTRWDVSRVLDVIRPIYSLLKGAPTDGTMASVYWRKAGGVPATPNPDRDGCGLYWCSPVVPSTGRDVEAVSALARDVVLRHGFEPQMSISLATERSSICVITISYDRHVPGEDQRARRCYDELAGALLARGYPPYRLNVASMELMQAEGAYGEALARIKAALDPSGILAPGRYDATVPRAEERTRGAGAA